MTLCPALMIPVTADKVYIGGSPLQIKGLSSSMTFVDPQLCLLVFYFFLQAQCVVILVMS